MPAAPNFAYRIASRSPSPGEPGSSRGLNRSRLACLSCRVRKTKCNGDLPCNHCTKAGKECSYEERRKPELSAKALSDKLATLQDRYDRLSTASGGGSRPTTPNYSNGMGAGSAPRDFGQASEVNNQEIPTELRDRLLHIMFANASKAHFECHAQRFMHSLRTQPQHLQPHPAFVNAMMLLATHFASPLYPLPPTTPTPEFFVARTRYHLNASLAVADRILDFIGASTLLTWWLFQQGRMLEGQYEISSTARLCINCGMHRIDGVAVREALGGTSQASRSAPSLLPPPSGANDLELRISRFWTVFLMEKTASLLTGSPSSFEDFSPLTRITTIWPRPFGSYESNWTLTDFNSVDELMGCKNQHSGLPSALGVPSTILSAECQAIALLARATKLSSVSPRSLPEAQELGGSITSLQGAITRFAATLPTMDRIPSPHPFRQSPVSLPFNARSASGAFFACALLKTYTHIALTQLFRASDNLAPRSRSGETPELAASHERRVSEVQKVVYIARDIAREMNMFSNSNILDITEGLGSMFGYLWTSAAVVLVENINRLRNPQRRSPSAYSRGNSPAVEASLADLSQIRAAMRHLSVAFPLLDLQLKKVEQMIDDVRN